jgi:hypothetical protein
MDSWFAQVNLEDFSKNFVAAFFLNKPPKVVGFCCHGVGGIVVLLHRDVGKLYGAYYLSAYLLIIFFIQ